MTANIDVAVIEIDPVAGATLDGYKLGWLYSVDKVAANDTFTVKNAKEIKEAFLQIKATGVAESNTISTNVVTMTAATSGSAISGLLIYRD